MITNKIKMLALAALSASALGVAACSEGTPSASSPASIRTEPATTTTSERVFQANADAVTLIDVALVFAYLQVGADATPEAIVEAINSLTGETLTVADFDDPFPTFAEASGFIAPADSVDLDDVAAFFAVLQGADGEDAVAAAVAQLTGSAFDASSIIVLPGSGTTTASPSPSPSPTAPPLPMPEEGETFTIFVNPDATAIGNGSEATPFSTVVAANTFAIDVQTDVANVDLIISVVAAGEEELDGDTIDLTNSLNGGTRTLTAVDGFSIVTNGNTVTVGADTEVVGVDFEIDSAAALTITGGAFTGPSTVTLDLVGTVAVGTGGGDDIAVTATSFVPESTSTEATALVTINSTGEVVFNDVNLRTNEVASATGLTVTAAAPFAYTAGDIEVSTDTLGVVIPTGVEATVSGIDVTVAEGDTVESIGISAPADSSDVTITGSTFSIDDGGLGIDLSDGANSNVVANSAVIEDSTFSGTATSFAISVFEDAGEAGFNDDLITQYEEAGNTFTGFGLLGAIQQES